MAAVPPHGATSNASGTVEATQNFASSTTEATLAEALQVLRRRKWILLGAIVLGLLYGFYQSVTQPIRYTASGRLQIGSGATAAYRTPGTTVGENLNNEMLVLQSESLMLTVGRELDLANNPAFFGITKGQLPHRNIDDPGVRQAVVGTLLGSVKLTLIPGTQVLIISCVSADPKLSADIVNHVMNAYIRHSYQSRFASTDRVSQWLVGKLNDLKLQVEASQAQLIDMQRKLGVLGLSFDPSRPPTTESTARVDALSSASGSARVARILAESKYRTLLNADPGNLEGLLDASGMDGELNRLRGDIATAKATIAEDSVTLAARNPKLEAEKRHLAELEREVNAEQNRLLSQSHDAFIAAQANEQQTEGALAEAKNQAYQLRDSLVEYTLRQREYDTNRTLYENLLARLRGAGVQAGLDSLEIDIIDPAQLPSAPTLRPTISILIQTGLFGLVAGVVIAFLVETLDTGLRSVADVESATQLPTLAVVPRTRGLASDKSAPSVARANLGVLDSSKPQFAEAIRSLRTSLLLATSGHPPKVITISSSTPGEGKTTLSTNLACVFAQRQGRVLLIDADMRRPNVHHRFGLQGRFGLSSVLSGATTLDSALQSIPELPQLDILSSGPIPPFPTEMLSSQEMHDLLEVCRSRYTHVIIDTPPVLSVTDSVILSRQSDAFVLVLRQGKSSRQFIRRSRDLLVRAGAPVTGVVLNGVTMNSPEYYSYYGPVDPSFGSSDQASWQHAPATDTTPAGDR